MATLTACVGSGPTAPPLASPRRTVAQSQPKDTKPRRSKRPLLDRASTYVPPTWQNGARCRFASSQAHLSSWPNPHSTRGTAAAHIPRFRALALFGRRPLERVDSPAIPASENLHISGNHQWFNREVGSGSGQLFNPPNEPSDRPGTLRYLLAGATETPCRCAASIARPTRPEAFASSTNSAT
jgi:hypothetical protein